MEARRHVLEFTPRHHLVADMQSHQSIKSLFCGLQESLKICQNPFRTQSLKSLSMPNVLSSRLRACYIRLSAYARLPSIIKVVIYNKRANDNHHQKPIGKLDM